MQHGPRRQQLAQMMGRRAADADAVDGDYRHTPQGRHDRQRRQTAGHGKEPGRDAAADYRPQGAAQQQDGQGLPEAQPVEGVDRDQVGQPQLDAGQGDQQLQGEKPLCIGEGQGQRGQHRAQGQLFGSFHGPPPYPVAASISAPPPPTSRSSTPLGRHTMVCPA